MSISSLPTNPSAQSGRDHERQIKDYGQHPLKAKDATTGADITDASRVAQIWVKDEPQVRQYSSSENALRTLEVLEKAGKTIRVVYAQNRESGIKLSQARPASCATRREG
ncbi:hypothetical protein [Bradyrhizobium brasilense]|uniref:hypothetical protein n=1 Tax=Bradyrhizobium brasilense TaxID=1419277 RepID=UPI001E575AB6|nr:hypothetical protein [Bradyrhizobium brasilense]MCC8968947.1 hypothetical protein [Bradyrhizobium brasilense]